MKIVYAFTCHKMTNPLKHTVNYLSSFSENIILIHVDKKSNLEDFKILNNPNVHFISSRVNVRWGSISQIQSVLELMKASLTYSYDYFFLLSGEDIPLKTDKELKKLLSQYSNYNFLYFDEKMKDEVIEQRVKYIHPDIYYQRDKKLITKFQKKIFRLTRNWLYINKHFVKNNYRLPKLYKGTNWLSIKKETVEYILKYIKDNNWFLEIFDKSFCCDEVIFHTIIKTNPDIKFFEHPDYPIPSLRYIDWKSGPDYPRVLTEADKDKMATSNCFFARKINANASSDFMNSFLIEN